MILIAMLCVIQFVSRDIAMLCVIQFVSRDIAMLCVIQFVSRHIQPTITNRDNKLNTVK